MEKNILFCNNCSINYPIPLYKSLTSNAPYPKLLDTRNYIELSDDLRQLLNQGWTLSPQMKYAAAQLLAGCILQNQLNGKVVIANTVEVYGRKRSVDIHCEPFGTKKQSTIPTSLPPSVVLRYDNVYPVILNSQVKDFVFI